VRCPDPGAGNGSKATNTPPHPESVPVFMDAQAASMASEGPCPGQKYAIPARTSIATLRKAKPGIRIEIRWCPVHKGEPGNEKADEGTKLAAEERDASGWRGSAMQTA
jgi:ribonuclease HI